MSQNDQRQKEDGCDGVYTPVGVERKFATSRIFEHVSPQPAIQAWVPTLTPQRSRRPRICTLTPSQLEVRPQIRTLTSMSNTSKKSVDLTPKPLLVISASEELVDGIVLAYLPGVERLVTCTSYGIIKLWNVENGEQEGMAMAMAMAMGDGDDYGYQRLAVTKDGKMILSSALQVLRVWDAETQQPIAEWGNDAGDIWCIAMSPDDQLVATGHDSGRIVIREMNLKEDGPIKHTMESGLGIVYSM